VSQPQLFALMGVGDGHALELVLVVVDDGLFLVAHHDQQFLRAEFDELLETVRENRFASDFDHALGLVLGERAKSCPFSGGEYDGLHTLRASATA